MGEGVTTASPDDITLQATGGSGADNAGADFILAGGKSTGDAAPGSIVIKTSTVGASGATPQTLATRVTITSALVDIEDLDITTTGDLTIGENDGFEVVSNYGDENNTRIGLNKAVDDVTVLFDAKSVTVRDATFKFDAYGTDGSDGGNAYMWLKGNTADVKLAFRVEDESGNDVFMIRNTRYADGYNGGRHDDLLISNERVDRSILFRTDTGAGGVLRMEIDEDGFIFMGTLGSNYAEIKADGEINLHGTARVTNAVWIGAQALKAPGVKPAVFVDHGISGAWQFTDGTDDTIVANMRIPNRMDRTVVPTLSLGWSSTATSLIGVWQVEYLWRAADEDTTVAADATLTSNATSSATAEGMVTTTFTLAAPSATDVCLHLRIKRRADLVADTLAVDAELHGICMNFTSNKLGGAT